MWTTFAGAMLLLQLRGTVGQLSTTLLVQAAPVAAADPDAESAAGAAALGVSARGRRELFGVPPPSPPRMPINPCDCIDQSMGCTYLPAEFLYWMV